MERAQTTAAAHAKLKEEQGRFSYFRLTWNFLLGLRPAPCETAKENPLLDESSEDGHAGVSLIRRNGDRPAANGSATVV